MPIPVSLGLLQKFDVAGPRYTSYPTADRFVEAFGDEEYTRMVCVETANASANAISLDPGESHTLAATISADAKAE